MDNQTSVDVREPQRNPVPAPSLMERYRDWLPLNPDTPCITLGEGGTPLIACQRLASRVGIQSLHVKFEGLNPTGSFKDRGMVLAAARALEAGSTTLICASTGNTSASAAAYGARCGMRVVVVIPGGKVAAGKLAQAQVFGAKVLAIEGNFDTALRTVRELAATYPATLVNSVNPFRIEGQKTAAFEIVDELGDAPDIVALPVGNAGNITAQWKGFREYHAAGRCHLPKMIGGQAAGAAPFVAGRLIAHPDTIATAIRIGAPASWDGAITARDESDGVIAAVTDDEILAAQRDLARLEGIFCEPASAASVAVVHKLRIAGEIAPDSSVVCILTGNGLKDIDVVSRDFEPPIPTVSDPGAIAHLLDL